MALTTYSELLQAIDDHLGRGNDDLSDAFKADFVTLAEVEIYDRIRVREMETSADLTLSAQAVALPTGFVGLRRIYLDTAPIQNVSYLSPDAFWREHPTTASGLPCHCTIEGENVLFGPVPDSSYTAKMLYWKRLTALSSSTNNLFLRHPELWLYGALQHACEFIRDDEMRAQYGGLFEKALAATQQSDLRDRFATPLAARPTFRLVGNM